jgi:hypothetical protein
LWGEYRRKKMQKVAYAAIIIYDKINRGEEIPAAASIIQDANPNKKTNIDSFIFSIRILL